MANERITATKIWEAVDRIRATLPQWIKEGRQPQKYTPPNEYTLRKSLENQGFEEISPNVWKKGQHVVISGDYKPLAKNFQPSITGTPCS